MANVLITNYCNRKCSYCFAREEVNLRGGSKSNKNTDLHISLENLDKAIRFFKRSEMKVFGILGGEPTLHPAFPQIIDRVITAGFDIKLFTGGLAPRRAIDCLKSLDPAKLTVITNVSCVNDTSEQERIRLTLRELSKFTMLGYTIYKSDFEASFLIELIKESGSRPSIRLGIGLPMVNADHPLIHPNEYKTTAYNILKLAELCDRNDISLKFDCGFALCMFSPEEIGYLKAWICDANFRCSPIIDIGPDLNVWPCFPLSSMFKTHLDKFETRQEVADFYYQKFQGYRTFGIHDTCHTCKYKRHEMCAGGCLSHTIRSFKS